jgi:hypothetical protein
VIVTQSADPLWQSIDLRWFEGLAWLLDGRNSLDEIDLPPGVSYAGIGVPVRVGR